MALKTIGFWLLVYCGYFVVQSVLNLFFQPNYGELFEQIAGSKHLGAFLFIVVLTPVMMHMLNNTIVGVALIYLGIA